MRFSTFYKSGGKQRVYTTKSHTEHHKFLRESHGGATYEHADNIPTHFILGMPLEKPIKGQRVV